MSQRKIVIFPVSLMFVDDAIDAKFVAQVNECSAGHWFVAVSNRPEPALFKKSGIKAVFCNARPRENGKFVQKLLDANQEKLKVKKSQVVILGFGKSDIPMFANSKSVLIRCDWRADIAPEILRYGIPCPDITQLPYVLKLLDEEHPWYFTQKHAFFDTYCLTNAATKKGNDEEFKALAAKFQNILKNGPSKQYTDFITHALSSLYATEIFAEANIWTYYPSSSSNNTGQEVIASFAEMPRTTFGIHRKPHPLIIRHTATASRHAGSQVGRDDPTVQIRSIRLHEDYKNVIADKTVVVLDDFMNYGVSFCVAAAFLRKAGAKKVIAVAMGKFPRSFYLKEIEILSDPFAPVHDFKVVNTTGECGTYAPEASEAFKRKFL